MNFSNLSQTKFFINERLWSFVFWFLSLIFLDQICKYLIFNFAREGVLAFLGRPFVGIILFYNQYFAFSLPFGSNLIYSIYFLVLTIIVVYLYFNFQKLSNYDYVGWLLVVAGAVSNIAERIISGRVQDFIYILSGIFNLADFYIILGLLILLFAKKKKL